jgi:NAD(P)-dependent dehydrogenase (short-subunit alcohol dehydrogenase family)
MRKNLSIIFGGTKGIGLEIYKNLKKRGDNVLAIARNKKKNVKTFSLDLLDDNQISRFLDKFTFHKISNLIFSQRYRGSDDMSEYKMMISSTERIINKLYKTMPANSSIVFISSISVLGCILDQNLNYHMVRGALDQMSKYLAVKFGKRGIRVNTILATRLIKEENKNFYNKKNNSIRKNLEKITPLGRMAESKDVANLVNFLTCEKSEYITGERLKLDGGLSLINNEHITLQK